MRTWITNVPAPAPVAPKRPLPLKDLLPDLAYLLAGINTVGVTVHHADGSSTHYSSVEYECEDCGQYGHEAGNPQCPTFDDELDR